MNGSWKSVHFHIFCVRNKEKQSDGKKLVPSQNPNVIGTRWDTLQATLSTKRKGRSLIGKQTSRHLWLETYLSFPSTSRTDNSSSVIAEVQSPIKKREWLCLLHGFVTVFVPEDAKSILYFNTIPNTIGSYCPSQGINDWTH